jgi:nucleolar protein 58
MQAIAPNLTHVVGELVGARLISHAGSLINLAKQPSSTLQILGAEKALFRALKAKHNTPKYGLIYHASLIGQASNKNKGRIARVLAAKCSLSSRVDALGEKEQVTIGLPSKDIVENRLAVLEGLATKAVSALPKGSKSTKQVDRSVEHSAKLKTSNDKIHDDSMDVTVEKSKKRKREDGSDEEEKKKEKKKEKKEKKDKEEKKEKKDKDEKKKEKKDKEEKKDKKKKDK